MREIKFRAWDERRNKMFYDSMEFYRDLLFSYPQATKEEDHIGFGEFERSRGFIMEQYTGLRDKNQVEIYEGDLITNASGRISEVVWHSYTGAWDCECRKTTRNDSCLGFEPANWGYQIIVIGNIHADESQRCEAFLKIKGKWEES